MVRMPVEVMTLDHFLRLPEFKPAFEFVGGRVIQKMSPMLPHIILQKAVVSALDAFALPRKLGEAYAELRCTFGGQSLVYDVSFYLEERFPIVARRKRNPSCRIPPDIAVEIHSPGQPIRELVDKLEHGIRNGTSIGWLIRPIREDLRVFRPGRDAEVFRAGDIVTGEDVLPGFSMSIADLFNRLDRR